MLKTIVFAAIVSSSLFAAAALPAQAAITKGDCDYARQTQDQHGIGHGDYSYSTHLVEQCSEKGL